MSRKTRRTGGGATHGPSRSPRPERAAESPSPSPSETPIISWRRIHGIIEALVGEAEDRETLNATARLLMRLTAPHRLLEQLHLLAPAVLRGDSQAAAEMRRRIDQLNAALPRARATARAIEQQADEPQCRCHEPEPAVEEPGRNATVYDAALFQLFRAVVTAYDRCKCATRHREADAEVEAETDAETAPAFAGALEAVFGISLMAAPLDRMVAAFSREGISGLAREMTWLGAMMPPPMMPLRGGMPGIPGIPGLPEIPIPKSEPGELPALVAKIIGLVKGPRIFDPELHDHRPIEVIDGPHFVDIERVRCHIALVLALKRYREPPPARPARVVWSDNITSVETTGACAGDGATIRGSGFGSPKPANHGIVVPIAGVCTPMEVDPAAWTDTTVRFTLPPGVTSGPIGFVDLGYVKIYNQWVDRVNAARQAALAAAKCARERVSLPVMPYFSECPPQTPFNRLRAGSALIKSFTVNWATSVVSEPADALTLRWDVINAEQLTVQRVSSTGPLFAGASTLMNPPAVSSFLLGPASHTGPATFLYRVTAVGPCGTVTADVTVIASRRPGLKITGIEVTQSIQTLSNDVALVAMKPTVVRVTVNHSLAGWGANTVPNVTGRVRLRRGLGDVTAWFDPANGSNPMAATPGANITVPASPQRTNTNHTLNFLLPSFQCFGSAAAIEVEVRVNGFDARAGFAGFSESLTRSQAPITFQNRRALTFFFIRVNWGGSTPTPAVCDATLRGAIPLLPTPTAGIAELAGVGVQTAGGTTNSDRDDLIDEFDDRHNCSAWEALTEWLGSDCPDDDGAIWVLIPGVFFRGRAYDIPSNVCFTPPSDGPYAAHELSHCLNQVHLGVNCANGQTAGGSNAEAPSTWPNNGQVVDVPFDVTSNSTVTGSGNGVWDVMTYCGTTVSPGVSSTWPMPRRWQQLWNEIGA